MKTRDEQFRQYDIVTSRPDVCESPFLQWVMTFALIHATPAGVHWV